MEGISSHRHIRRHLYEHAHAYVSRASLESQNRQIQELVRRVGITETPSRAVNANAPARVVPRADCTSANADSSICEKPASANSLTIPIAIVVVVVVVGALCVMVYLHRRATKRAVLEDQDERYKSMDFGLDQQKAAKANNKRLSAMFGAEKEGKHTKGQLSMDDMNLASPYLLPPELQSSRESMNSLAKTLHQQEDPYRHAGSQRSSVLTARSQGGTRQGSLPHSVTSSRQDSLPISVKSASRQDSLTPSPLAVASVPPTVPSPDVSKDAGFRFTDDDRVLPKVSATNYTEEPTAIPVIQEPARVAQKGAAPSPRASGEAPKTPYKAYQPNRDSSALPASDLQGLGILDAPKPPPTTALPTPPTARIDSKHVQSVQSVQSDAPSAYNDYAEHFQFHVEDGDKLAKEERGRATGPQEKSAGLETPEEEKNRLSVGGTRPLPPDDYLESEDPEFRANRIRSFYKEYFEDSKEARPPVPALPQAKKAQYYEDVERKADGKAMGDAAFFDPVTNAFVMPYAEPVTRRAMTPPPRNRMPMPGPPRGPGGRPGPGPRGPPGPPGPRGPHGPHGPHHGSMGGSPMGPGRGRADSRMSGRTNMASPRPGSSASARVGPAPKSRKPMPPAEPLSTLPIPALMKDDSFAIMNSMDFAPPPSMKDVARGRSQSPMGERRPYELSVPASTPLVSSFDEMAAMPSPHALRKSGTFTGLDFLPPKKFKDPETMSDSGSVRSMGSGISSAGQQAVRNGAGRVSRLPGDQVFTAAENAEILKPKWDMAR